MKPTSRIGRLLSSPDPDVAALARAAWSYWHVRDEPSWDRFRRLMVELLGEEGKP